MKSRVGRELGIGAQGMNVTRDSRLVITLSLRPRNSGLREFAAETRVGVFWERIKRMNTDEADRLGDLQAPAQAPVTRRPIRLMPFLLPIRLPRANHSGATTIASSILQPSAALPPLAPSVARHEPTPFPDEPESCGAELGATRLTHEHAANDEAYVCRAFGKAAHVPGEPLRTVADQALHRSPLRNQLLLFGRPDAV